MSLIEINNFINSNRDHEKLKDYYDKLYEKLKYINKRLDRLTLYLIISVFASFLVTSAKIQSLNVGPIQFSDISIIAKILPVLFSFLLLDLTLTSSHRIEVFNTVKHLFNVLYRQEVNDSKFEFNKSNFITRVLMPFSYNLEFSKLHLNKINYFQAIIGLLVIFPFLTAVFLPFYIEYLMLKNIYLNHFSDGLGKICFILSIWVTIVLLYFYFTNEYNKSNETNPT